MNKRIDAVLSGEITEAAVILPPGPTTPSTVYGGEAALREGFDLPGMLPSLSDLPGGVALDRDGFTNSDAIGSYERAFEPEGLVFELGSSQVIGISTSVELQETELEAQGPVLFIRAADPQLFGELAGASFAKVAGFTPENIVFEGLDVPQVGDAIAG